MKLIDKPKNIITLLSIDYPEIPGVLANTEKMLPKYKGSIQPFQAAALYYLASKHVPTYGQILEIGTGLGYSSFVMSSARSSANITTLTPNANERKIAIDVLSDFSVDVLPHKSRDFFELDETKYDLIFVDGNHNDIAFDCGWYTRLTDRGLIVFHDYSPNDAWSPQPTVYNHLNKMKVSEWGYEDYLFVDDGKVGMIAWSQHGIQKHDSEQIVLSTTQNLNL